MWKSYALENAELQKYKDRDVCSKDIKICEEDLSIIHVEPGEGHPDMQYNCFCRHNLNYT